jgi:hypothetical protein
MASMRLRPIPVTTISAKMPATAPTISQTTIVSRSIVPPKRAIKLNLYRKIGSVGSGAGESQLHFLVLNIMISIVNE